MVQPTRRRESNPDMVQKLWESIAYIRHQKQIPNLDRIAKYILRVHNIKYGEVDQQLQCAVNDGLVMAYTAVGFKGSRVGLEQEGYRLPDNNPEDEKDGHDWYCFDCHQPGEVVECEECWRVYHPTCTDEEWNGDKFVCSVCKETKKKPRMKRKEISRLLGYTILRLKDKTKDLHAFKIKDELDTLRVERLMYRYMDLNRMEAKCDDRKYKYLDQFYTDCRTILHNVYISYGDTGPMADLAKIMMKDCKYDLDEVNQCKYCYHYSNAKPKDWFCQPCRPSHELVYAKQKGFSYWPAKVIKATPEGYDVRFFGGWHQRAFITRNMVKTIDVAIKSLTIKRTSGFSKACSELARHQQLLVKMAAAEAEGAGETEEEIEEEEETEEPEIRHKKFRKRHREDEADISSSVISEKPAPTPEDANLVTSSEDNVPATRIFSTSDIGVQTSKKLLHPGKPTHKASQTDTDVEVTSCNCEGKYNKIVSDLKTRLEGTHQEEQEKALKELEERLRKDLEDEKGAAVSRASAILQRDVDRTRRQTEERCKEQYLEEMKKVAQKHKTEVSAAKKKQWCYNCEEEAMYHCCWNTSYCSIKCQQEHWHREHKRMCRRKRT